MKLGFEIADPEARNVIRDVLVVEGWLAWRLGESDRRSTMEAAGGVLECVSLAVRRDYGFFLCRARMEYQSLQRLAIALSSL